MSILKLIDDEVILIIPRDELRAVWIERFKGGPTSTLVIRGREIQQGQATHALVLYTLSTSANPQPMTIECADEEDAMRVLDWFMLLSQGTRGTILVDKRDGRWSEMP